MYIHCFKRIFDFVCALIALPFLMLITCIIGIAIKIDDGGPVFYGGKRLGRRGKLFPMWKYRSMSVNAPDIRLEDGCTYNSKDDPRVTRVGRILRKTSIDELPQFFNVLLGQMSMIGPRPDTPEDLALYTEEEKQILSIRPGITGWNQVINRNSVGAKEKLRNDIYYVRHVSFSLDMKIVWLTVKGTLGQNNIYRTMNINQLPPHAHRIQTRILGIRENNRSAALLAA